MAEPNTPTTPTTGAGSAADMLSEAGQAWMQNEADKASAGVVNPNAAEGWQNGGKTTWGDGITTVSDGKQNVMGWIDSAGNTHTMTERSDDGYHWVDPTNRQESIDYQNTWLDLAKAQMEAQGHVFNGDGSEWNTTYGQNANGWDIDWDSLSGEERRAMIQRLGITGYGPWTIGYDPNAEVKPVGMSLGNGMFMRDDGTIGGVYDEGWGHTYKPAIGEENLVPRSSVTGGGYGGGYGGTGGGDTPIGGGVDPGVYGQLMDIYNSLQGVPENSPAYAEAMENYRSLIGQHPELVLPEAERNYTDFQAKDYTKEIIDIYDKNITSAVTQIKNQLQQGEIDIDRAIEKLPAIYESGMNDMATQFEINKRNANEYFNANGLSSGAKAQAALAMNNVYQQNMSAYRLEQANAVKSYEEKRADLRLQAEASITEAVLQNDSQRAQALLQEYQRQDQQNFQFLLQKMDDDYRYYALEVDKALKTAAFQEEQRQTDMNAWLKQAEIEQSNTQFQQNYKLNVAKLQADIITTQQEIALKKAELAEKQREFNLELQENGRQFDQNLALKIRQLETEISQSEAELRYKYNALDEEKRQFDVTIGKKYGETVDDQGNQPPLSLGGDYYSRMQNKNYVANLSELIEANYNPGNKGAEDFAKSMDDMIVYVGNMFGLTADQVRSDLAIWQQAEDRYIDVEYMQDIARFFRGGKFDTEDVEKFAKAHGLSFEQAKADLARYQAQNLNK